MPAIFVRQSRTSIPVRVSFLFGSLPAGVVPVSEDDVLHLDSPGLGFELAFQAQRKTIKKISWQVITQCEAHRNNF